MIDIGANLTDKTFSTDLANVIDNAFTNNVQKIILTGSDRKSSDEAKKIVETFTESKEDTCHLYSTAGFHPCYIESFGHDSIEYLKKLLSSKRVVAIGECGLDYFKMPDTKRQQIFCLEEQLKLAEELKKPIFLHERNAHDDMIEILQKHRSVHGVIHCFTGSLKELQNYLHFGYSVGITGSITDSRNVDLIKSLPYVPLDKLLIESDAPFLTPRNHKLTRRNEPAYLKYVVEEIAKIMNSSDENIVEYTTRNANKLFSL